MQLVATLTTLLAVIFTSLGGACRCFRGASRVLKRAEKHAQLTGLDRSLPLQGRWLRYATASLLVLLGILGLALAGFALIPFLWLVGDH